MIIETLIPSFFGTKKFREKKYNLSVFFKDKAKIKNFYNIV